MSTPVRIYVTHVREVPADRLHVFRGMLTDQERKRADAFRFERHRTEFLVTRGLVRTVLSEVAGVAPESLRFVLGEYGKPAIAGPEAALKWSFNVSNTDGMVALIVAEGVDVGVDVERIDQERELTDVAKRSFAETEFHDYDALLGDARQERFFAYWTLKESYIKARGMGLQLPLDKFWFDLSDGERIRIAFAPPIEDYAESWQFGRARPSENHRLAWAVKTSAPPVASFNFLVP